MLTVFVCLMLVLTSCSGHSESLSEDAQDLQGRDLVKECKTTVLGLEYMGKISKTISGRHCQRWTSNHPHRHGNHANNRFPDGSELAASNYCRNPDKENVGPWCYTTDPRKRWEACNVPLCTEIVYIFRADLELPSPMINNAGHPRRVPYNHVKMNVGGVYKDDLHAFVAPLPGVYMFMVDGLSAAKGPGCIELRKKNVIVDHAFTAGGLSSMSINMPLKLQKGDAVFVTMCPSRNTLHHHGENAFTGYLLMQTS